LKDAKNRNYRESDRMMRTNALLDSAGSLSNKQALGSMKKPDKNNWEDVRRRALQIKGKWDQDEATVTEETKLGPEAFDVHPEGNEIKAERFDFTLCEVFYAHNLTIDEFGERVMSQNIDIGRVVSKDGIVIDHYSQVEEEEEVELDGKVIARREVDAPIIPVTELVNVYYFQWRIDKLEH